jgi:Ni/Co efflux regulator RcnB
VLAQADEQGDMIVRTMLIAATALAAIAFAGPAQAQRMMPRQSVQGWQAAPQVGGWHGGQQPGAQQPGAWQGAPAARGGNWQQGGARGSRWGARVGGHWYAGMNAPGGWGAYRRPSRGSRIPSYWIAPSFFIGDYAAYGLSQPPYGYNWSRYYDDAVLLDGNGQVWDSVSGIDWDRDGGGYAYDDGGDGAYAYAQGGQGGGYAYPQQQPQPQQGGYYADEAPQQQAYGAGYPPPRAYRQPAPRVTYAPSREVVQPGCCATRYANSGGYYYPPATTTTVTVQIAPAVTTTTTEYVEETTHYTAARSTWHPKRKVWHRPAPRQCSCTCTTTCR